MPTIPIDRIVSRLPVRKLSAHGVARIQESMQRSGFLDNYPVVVAPFGNDTYQLIEGNHRLEAAQALGITAIPYIVKDDLTEQERFKLALQCNAASEAVVPSTMVTHAEFIWERTQDYTQQQIADMLGWSRGAISNYVALEKIDKPAWEVIATTFENFVAKDTSDVVAPGATTVAFTEGLLRSILDLTPSQQLDLVTDLASGAINKGRFKLLAENYHARNEMETYAMEKLGDLGEAYTTQLKESVHSGAYDTDWKDSTHPKLHKLLQSIRDEWEKKHSIFLVHGDFYEEAGNLGEGCVDLIITDPPYNVANEREFILEGRTNISQDFGEWDKYGHEEFISKFSLWGCEWARILRSQGSGYVFTSDMYISHLRAALEAVGLHVKATLVWHKTNPGTQVVKTNFKSSVEYILFFTKGEGGHTFNWQGENEMHNFIESPICGGGERVVDAKLQTLHPTQKPEKVIRHLMEISSNRGDTVFDGFMGVGTTGKVAKDIGRKFIGIEQEKPFFEAAKRRIEEDEVVGHGKQRISA